MSSMSFRPGQLPVTRTSRLLGPRPGLLIGFAALVLALLLAFAYVVVHSQSQARRQAEQRFGAQASIAAQLTASLFSASLTSAQATAAKTFGGRVIDDRSVARVPKNSGLLYRLILDRNGKVLAASPGAPATRAVGTVVSQAHVREALKGRAVLSDVLPAVVPGKGSALELAVPFKTAFGPRVEVDALRAALVSKFLSSYLGRTRVDGKGAAFVLDSQGRIVGAANPATKPGAFPRAAGLVSALASQPNGTYEYSGAEHYYTSSAVDGSSWRVVLSVRTNSLYPPLAGSSRWFLFAVLAAFALAAAASLVFFRRALTVGAELIRLNGALTSVNAGLEERVAERTAAAEERARELARSNEELEQFSSVASHDLQEPLRKIRMFGDRLRERLGDTLAEEPAADLARMEDAAQRMQRLINDLLDYSRVTHRGREFELVDLSKVAKEVVSDLEARVVELDASISVGSLPVIEADRTQMRQLIQNLVGNALKFHRDGEAPLVRITGEVVPGQPAGSPAASAVGTQCVITVADNGIGFDDKHSERVFTAFARLHGRTAYEGTGIGLSIARKIVWRHGGEITATSVPDNGATFTVMLPLSQTNGHAGGNSQ